MGNNSRNHQLQSIRMMLTVEHHNRMLTVEHHNRMLTVEHHNPNSQLKLYNVSRCWQIVSTTVTIACCSCIKKQTTTKSYSYSSSFFFLIFLKFNKYSTSDQIKYLSCSQEQKTTKMNCVVELENTEALIMLKNYVPHLLSNGSTTANIFASSTV